MKKYMVGGLSLIIFVATAWFARAQIATSCIPNPSQPWCFDGTGIRPSSAGALSDALVVLNSGLVGVGTSTPTSNLHVFNNTGTGTIRLGAGGTNNTALIFNSGGTFSDIYMSTLDGADNDILRIGGGGDVITTRGAVIDLQGNEAGGEVSIRAGDGGNFINLLNGNVGIGETAPTTEVQITGTSTPSLYIESSTVSDGGSIILEDTDGAGCTEITVLNGVVSGAIVTCP